MARLPRYQPLGVRPAAPAQLDRADVRETARMVDTVQQNIGRMSDFIYRRQVEQAERRGQQAVEEQGARPILARIEEAGGPTTISERAAYATANRVAAAEIQMEADQEIARVLDEAQRNLTPFSEVQARLQDITDGFSATLSTMDPEAAGLLRTRLQGDTGRANTRYASWYRDRQVAIGRARATSALDTAATETMSIALSPDATPELILENIQSAAETALAAGLDEGAVQTWQERTLAAATQEYRLYQFTNSSLTDQRAVAETVPTEPYPGRTYAQTLSEHRSYASAYRSNLAAIESEAREIQSSMETQLELVSSGFIPNDAELARIADSVDRLSEFSPQLVADYERFQYIATESMALRGLSVTELAERAELAREGVPGLGGPGLDTERELLALQLVERAQQAAAGALNDARAEAAPVLQDISTDIDTLSNELARGTNANLDRVLRITSRIETNFGGLDTEILSDESRAQVEAALEASRIFQEGLDAAPSELRTAIEEARGRSIELDGEFSEADQERLNQMQESLYAGILNELVGSINGGEIVDYAADRNLTRPVAGGQPEPIGRPITLDGGPEEITAQFRARRADLDFLIQRYGEGQGLPNQSFLRPEERAQLTAILSNPDAPAGTKLGVLDAIVRFGGENAMPILQSLSEEAPIYGHIGGLMQVAGERGISTAQTILSGMQSPEISGLGSDRFRDEFNRETGNAFANNPRLRNTVLEAATYFYRRMGELGVENFDDTGAGIEAAIKAVLGDYEIKPIGDGRSLIPLGFDTDLIEDFIENTPDFMSIPGLVLNRENMGQINPETLSGDSSGWFPNSVGRGQYIMMRMPDGGVFPEYWTDSNNNPIVINLEALTQREGQ